MSEDQAYELILIRRVNPWSQNVGGSYDGQCLASVCEEMRNQKMTEVRVVSGFEKCLSICPPLAQWPGGQRIFTRLGTTKWQTRDIVLPQ